MLRISIVINETSSVITSEMTKQKCARLVSFAVLYTTLFLILFMEINKMNN